MTRLREASATYGAMVAVLVTLSLAPLLPATHAAARGAFDGAWSVLIVTDAGPCDRAYRYAIHIVNGRIAYDESAVGVSGHVNASGHVYVRVSGGGQSARGFGRLYGNSGVGRWSGRSSASACSGHWQAERRG